MTKINLKQVKKTLILKDLYSFILEMWDAYETVPYQDCWVVEYLSECFMYSVKHFLPDYITRDWVSDEKYEQIKKNIMLYAMYEIKSSTDNQSITTTLIYLHVIVNLRYLMFVVLFG